MDKKMIKRLIAALVLVIVAGIAYLFLLNYSEKKEQEENRKVQEEEAAAVVFATDTEEVSALSFEGEEETLSFEKKDGTWTYPEDPVFRMNESKIEKLLGVISSISCTR